MEHVKGAIEALVAAAKEFGVGFWSVAAFVLLALAVLKSPQIIKAISTFVTEYRKTTVEIERKKELLALEIGRKKAKLPGTKKKETGK